MKWILLLLTTVFMNGEDKLLFNFSVDASLRDWQIVDDVVMGGRSEGSFTITKDGHGCFEGTVSLENYGGFSSVRYNCPPRPVSNKTAIRIRLKGDGKRYQLRAKHSQRAYQSYIQYFETTGEWQEITVPLDQMYPSFRGRRLPMANFDHEELQQLAFLIANKKAESFKLLIDKIHLVELD